MKLIVIRSESKAGADDKFMILTSTTYIFCGMEDGTDVYVNGVYDFTIDAHELRTVSLSENDIISSDKPLSFSRAGLGQTAIWYAFKGKKFAHHYDRYSKSFYFVATDNPANVSIYQNDIAEPVYTGSVGTGSYVSVPFSDTNSNFVIESDENIAAYVGQLGSSDCIPLYPSSTEIFGCASNGGHIIVTEDGTTITEYATDGTITSRGTYNKSTSVISIVNDASSQFSGVSVKIVADKPISAESQADSDGGEMTPFVSKESFGTVFSIPENEREWVKIISDVPTTYTVYDSSGIVSSGSLAGSESNGIFHVKLTGTDTYEGNIIKTDDPCVAYYESEADDETIMMAHRENPPISGNSLNIKNMSFKIKL